MARTKSPTLHPACKLFPLLGETELQELADDITENGLQNAIVLHDGKVLDGQNRLAACKLAGIEPTFVEWKGTGSPLHWVVSQNLMRRHLSASQRAAVALELLPMLEKEAKDRQRKSPGRGKKGSEKFADSEGIGKASEVAAKLVGANSRYIEIIKQVNLKAPDLIDEIKVGEIPTGSIDAIISDPIYPEVNREYGKITEAEWLDLMAVVVAESKRVLKPTGSAVFILQPNFDKIGKMRLWLWKFMLQAAEEWNLVQDCYWWAIDTLPSAAANRKHGLMRQSVKTCVWLGSPDCYRNQEAVLWEESEKHSTRKWSDRALQNRPSGYTVREGRTAQTSAMRGGTVPFNLLPIPNANTDDTGGHPASTPYDLAAWWCRYILPPKGVLLDMYCGSGTMLAAGLDNGASKVIGIEKERKYLNVAKKRVG